MFGKDIFYRSGSQNSFRAILVNLALVILLVVIISTIALSYSSYNFDFNIIYKYRYKFLDGFITTIEISIYSLFFSLFLGLILLLFSKSKIVFLNVFTSFYIEIIRGTPLIVQTLIFYYIIFSGIGITDRFISGILILSLFGSSYIAEIFRGAIDGVNKNQYDASEALGLNTYDKYKSVIFPQALSKILPALAGQLIYLVKDSSILSIIAVNEVTMKAQEINSYTYSSFEAYVPLAVFYLILTIPISIFMRKIEKRVTNVMN